MANLKISKELCKGCGLCVTACPNKVLRISKESNNNGYFVVEIFQPDKCRPCANCAVICPDCVIEVKR